MHILQFIVVSLFFLTSAVLIFLIMIQSGKGGSLGIMGGGSSSSAFGSSTVDVVEKASWWGIAIFFVLAILAALAFSDVGPKLPTGLDTETAPAAGTENQLSPTVKTGGAEKQGADASAAPIQKPAQNPVSTGAPAAAPSHAGNIPAAPAPAGH